MTISVGGPRVAVGPVVGVAVGVAAGVQPTRPKARSSAKTRTSVAVLLISTSL